MARQVHFVVVVDIDTKEWWVDDDTFTARFAKDEGTWNTDTSTWSATEDDDHHLALEILNPVGSQTDKEVE
jgi:hypothetical protein